MKSESPELFKDTIPFIGTFHQQMFYIYAVYKRLQGSGMEVVLVLSGVLAGGSVEEPERKALQKGCEIHLALERGNFLFKNRRNTLIHPLKKTKFAITIRNAVNDP